jgi:hypothetical protein
MNAFSPIAAGFRLSLQRPVIALAEIAWRWSFAGAAWMLGAMFLFEYLDSLPVTAVDRLLLASRLPVFISRALHRIFEGSALRSTEAGIVLLIGLALAWIAVASLGRVAILDSLVEEFQIAPAGPRRAAWASVVALNTLRFVLTLAALLGAAGAALLASSIWASTKLRAADAANFFGLMLFLVVASWMALNWLLSVAAIFPVAEDGAAFDSIGSVLRLCERRTGAVVVIGLLFGVAHLGLFVAATGIGMSILVAARPLGGGAMIFLGLVLIAAYTAVADFLYVSRLAAYVSLLRREETATAERSPAGGFDHATGSRIDPDELILSDVPLATI